MNEQEKVYKVIQAAVKKLQEKGVDINEEQFVQLIQDTYKKAATKEEGDKAVKDMFAEIFKDEQKMFKDGGRMKCAVNKFQKGKNFKRTQNNNGRMIVTDMGFNNRTYTPEGKIVSGYSEGFIDQHPYNWYRSWWEDDSGRDYEEFYIGKDSSYFRDWVVDSKQDKRMSAMTKVNKGQEEIEWHYPQIELTEEQKAEIVNHAKDRFETFTKWNPTIVSLGLPTFMEVYKRGGKSKKYHSEYGMSRRELKRGLKNIEKTADRLGIKSSDRDLFVNRMFSEMIGLGAPNIYSDPDIVDDPDVISDRMNKHGFKAQVGDTTPYNLMIHNAIGDDYLRTRVDINNNINRGWSDMKKFYDDVQRGISEKIILDTRKATFNNNIKHLFKSFPIDDLWTLTVDPYKQYNRALQDVNPTSIYRDAQQGLGFIPEYIRR